MFTLVNRRQSTHMYMHCRGMGEIETACARYTRNERNKRNERNTLCIESLMSILVFYSFSLDCTNMYIVPNCSDMLIRCFINFSYSKLIIRIMRPSIGLVASVTSVTFVHTCMYVTLAERDYIKPYNNITHAEHKRINERLRLSQNSRN